MVFVYVLDVHDVVKIRKLLSKQYVRKEKISKSPNILWLFCGCSDCSHYNLLQLCLFAVAQSRYSPLIKVAHNSF